MIGAAAGGGEAPNVDKTSIKYGPRHLNAMRVKRSLVVASLLVSLCAMGWLSYAAFFHESSAGPEAGDRAAGQGVPDPASLADPKARSGVEAQDEGGSPADLLFAGGAAVSGIVLVASMVLFRVEVRNEKSAQKAREDRSEYYRDLRQYNRQLKGPPRSNT